MKKGQTAMEYLMTYGWAILIILIVGGLLVYYGVFSIKPGASKQGFGLVDVSSPWDYNAAGTLRIKVENRVGTQITIDKIFVTDGTTAVIGNSSVDMSVSPGTTSDWIIADSTVAGSTGDAYSISVAIQYNVTGESFNSSGSLSGTRS
ncbi:MAG: hypothetical protein ACE5J4_03515 [Candidatus Aenigmatarchaeota archaeon]